MFSRRAPIDRNFYSKTAPYTSEHLPMARLKRTSPALDKATKRLSGLRTISETLDFGNGVTVADYDNRIQALQTHIANHNQLLASLDASTLQMTLLEKDLQNYSEKVLINAAARYGKDSPQYMQAGGTIRKPTSKKRTSTPPKTETPMTSNQPDPITPFTPPTTTNLTAILN
jgi:hypothetical protein